MDTADLLKQVFIYSDRRLTMKEPCFEVVIWFPGYSNFYSKSGVFKGSSGLQSFDGLNNSINFIKPSFTFL